jgi:hypothetical protein
MMYPVKSGIRELTTNAAMCLHGIEWLVSTSHEHVPTNNPLTSSFTITTIPTGFLLNVMVPQTVQSYESPRITIVMLTA